MTASATQTVIENYRSNIAQGLLHVEGKPLSLANYPWCPAIYDGEYSKILLKCGRQVAKSTTIAAFMIAECIGMPHFKTYYISPSAEQTRKFSHTRISKILAYSPELRKFFVGPESIDNVYLRMLRNGAEMAFTYADEDPDRARGYSADRSCFDEIQDMILDAVVPVIEESMSASHYAYSMYCGTPKTMENGIEELWSLSTQSEWCIRCTSCNRSTFIDSTKSFGKNGIECLNCRSTLNPRLGRWIDMKPGSRIKGFHIPQQIMPRNNPSAWPTSTEEYKKACEHWQEQLYKLEQWGEAQFYNECIGVSTATGARLLTKDLLESLCDENHEMTRLPLPNSFDGILRTFAGVDWSGGGGEVKGMEGLFKSRTVLHIWGDMGDGRLKTMYYKIFPNGHAAGWIDEIVELCTAWNVQCVVGDAGEGALANAMLRDRLGAHKVQQVRYLNMSKPMQYNPDNWAYHSDRTTLIDNYAMFLKHKRAVYPKMTQAHAAITDILNVFEETTLSGKKVWTHAPTKPDDCLHAQLFGWIAWKIVLGDLQMYA